MSFIIEINGKDITTIEEIRENFDIDVLLSHRDNFDVWLAGWDYEDEAAQVRDLPPDLSDDDWLVEICKIIEVSSATLDTAKIEAEKRKAEMEAARIEAEKKREAVKSRKKTEVTDHSNDFLMPIEDVFFIEGRGTAVIGRVERGMIKVGDIVEIIGLEETQKVTISRIEKFRQILDQAQAGDNVACTFYCPRHDDVKCGQVLAKLGSIAPHTKFIANLDVWSKVAGGRYTPFFNNYRPQFYFRTTDVTGTITLPEDIEMVMPGENVTLTIELVTPIAMTEGLCFAMREGGRKVADGTVKKILV